MFMSRSVWGAITREALAGMGSCTAGIRGRIAGRTRYRSDLKSHRSNWLE